MLGVILAGGKGTRLGKLTHNQAKPAVPFGGRYRIIDFTLSNCVNSGVKNIGVITQYQHLNLNAHIGNGARHQTTKITKFSLSFFAYFLCECFLELRRVTLISLGFNIIAPKAGTVVVIECS